MLSHANGHASQTMTSESKAFIAAQIALLTRQNSLIQDLFSYIGKLHQKNKHQQEVNADLLARVEALQNQLDLSASPQVAAVPCMPTRSPSPTLRVRQSHSADRLARTPVHSCVLFADIVGYTRLSKQYSNTLIFDQIIQPLFAGFDQLMPKHNAIKVKTVGDAYMAAQDVSVSYSFVASQMIDLGMDMLKVAAKINSGLGETFGRFRIKLRIGIHMGECHRTVDHNLMADYFGHVVNTASRMESSSEPDQIQVSEEVAKHIWDYYPLQGITRTVKGLGAVITYQVQQNSDQKLLQRRSSFMEVETSRHKLLRTYSMGDLPVQLMHSSSLTQTEQQFVLDDPNQRLSLKAKL